MRGGRERERWRQREREGERECLHYLVFFPFYSIFHPDPNLWNVVAQIQGSSSVSKGGLGSMGEVSNF
jgi:hypothetical protein